MVSLASPTGRAGQNLAEVTGMDAGTVHRLLNFRPGKCPEHDETNPLPCDLFVVGEVSMLDITLAAVLFRAIDTNRTRVLLVGDADQLPSVGPGNVLHDLLAAGVPSVRLKHIFRQAAESQIVTNAHRVNACQHVIIDHNKGDFYFMRYEEPGAISAAIVASAKRMVERYSVGEVQVLSPMKKGDIGAHALKALAIAVKNNKQAERKTSLKERLIGFFQARQSA